MSTASLNALPTRHEVHFGGRVVRCFVDRAPSVWAGFERSAREHASNTALNFGERCWTYRELDAEIARVSAGLAIAGVRAGQRVVLQVGNRPEFIFLFYALQRLGAVTVPTDVRLQGDEIAHVANDCDARLLIHDEDLADRARVAAASKPGLACMALPPHDATRLFADVADTVVAPNAWLPGEDDVAVILYTSGTTGHPKGAALAHLNIAHSTIHHSGNLGLGQEDRCVVAVPLSHVTGLICGVVAPLWCGSALTVLPSFKAREFLPAAARARMTYTIMVPAMYNLCLRVEGFDWAALADWRLGHFGGAQMPTATIEALAARLPKLTLVNGYGATETCSPAIMLPVGEPDTDIATVGRALACVDLLVMDPETCAEVPAGASGELWIRGPMVASHYWNNPEATARGIVNGYWRSGDIGSVDRLGNVRIHDRLKDLINRAGYKIYSAEVEAVLARCPGVIEVAVVGRPDSVLGEKVHAFVHAAEGTPETELVAHCERSLADYKVPETWTLSSTPLPKNASGKLDKKEMRARAATILAPRS